MPNNFDETHHYRYAKPVYDAVYDKKTIQNKRVLDSVLEPKLPPIPT